MTQAVGSQRSPRGGSPTDVPADKVFTEGNLVGDSYEMLESHYRNIPGWHHQKLVVGHLI